MFKKKGYSFYSSLSLTKRVDDFYMSYKSKINKIRQTYDFDLRKVI